jgi:hypothetical protein
MGPSQKKSNFSVSREFCASNTGFEILDNPHNSAISCIILTIDNKF